MSGRLTGARLEALRARLATWLERHPGRALDDADESSRSKADSGEIDEQLRALGYRD